MSDATGDHGPELSPPLVDALVEFQAAVERTARGVIAAANEQAASREREAVQAARWIEQDAERRAERILQAALERAWLILQGVDAVGSGPTATGDPLHGEAARLAADIGAHGAAPQGAPSDRAPELEAATGGVNASPSNPAAAGQPGAEALSLAPPRMRRAVRATLHELRRQGGSRDDAERFLARLELDDEHRDVVDEVYGAPNIRTARRQRRGGLFDRLARGS